MASAAAGSAVSVSRAIDAPRSRRRARSVAIALGSNLDQLVALEAKSAQQLAGTKVVGPDFDRHVLVRGVQVVVPELVKPHARLGQAADVALVRGLAAELQHPVLRVPLTRETRAAAHGILGMCRLGCEQCQHQPRPEPFHVPSIAHARPRVLTPERAGPAKENAPQGGALTYFDGSGIRLSAPVCERDRLRASQAQEAERAGLRNRAVTDDAVEARVRQALLR